jgi:predicted negative regulator of RcsB-dependent stress response
MLAEIQDRDAIFSRAIQIASADERDAYIAEACGSDAALRQQVQHRVAAHFKARDAHAPPHVVAATHAHPRHETASAPPPRKSGMTLFLILLAAAGVSIGLTVWAMRAEERARRAAQESADEHEHVLKAEEEVKHHHEQTEASRLTTAKERDQLLAAARAAQRSEEDARAVLAFLRDKVFSAGHPQEVSGGEGTEVTLRKSVDAAEAEVAKTFSDRPLAEASLRETFGSAYLDLGQAAPAVKQYERALSLRESKQGGEHPETLACRNKLAVAYRLAGRTIEAGRLYDQKR